MHPRGQTQERPDPSHPARFGKGFRRIMKSLVILLAIGVLCNILVLWIVAEKRKVASGSPDRFAEVSIRNAATAEESYFKAHGTYADSIEKLTGKKYLFFLHDGVSVLVAGADEKHYTLKGFHKDGDNIMILKGPNGGIEKRERSRH